MRKKNTFLRLVYIRHLYMSLQHSSTYRKINYLKSKRKKNQINLTLSRSSMQTTATMRAHECECVCKKTVIKDFETFSGMCERARAYSRYLYPYYQMIAGRRRRHRAHWQYCCFLLCLLLWLLFYALPPLLSLSSCSTVFISSFILLPPHE